MVILMLHWFRNGIVGSTLGKICYQACNSDGRVGCKGVLSPILRSVKLILNRMEKEK